MPDQTRGLTPRDEAEATPPPATPPPALLNEIFLGSEGLRAGWSLLLYFALLLTLMAAGGSLSERLLPSPALSRSTTLLAPKMVFVGVGVEFLCVVVATWAMARIERRPNSVFGLGSRRALSRFLAGLGWGFALLSLLVLSLRAAGLLVFDARLLFGRSALRYGAIWLIGFLIVGLHEEYLFRGYMQITLARGLSCIYGWFHAPARDALGFWTAAVLLSFGFGATHRSNAGESPIGLLAAGVIGVVFCLSLWRTGSLWWAIGFHAAWDWAQSFIYGVADSGLVVRGHLFATHPAGKPILSGGLTGPEGSLFILPICALIAGVIVFTLPDERSRYAAADARSATCEDAAPPQLHLDLQ